MAKKTTRSIVKRIKKKRADTYEKKLVIPEEMTFDKMITLSIKPKDDAKK